MRRALAGHAAATVYEIGWSSLANGDLLREADSKYELLITTDQNLQYQQNLAGRRLAILVQPTTSWPQLRPHAQEIAAAALLMSPGEYREFTLPA